VHLPFRELSGESNAIKLEFCAHSRVCVAKAADRWAVADSSHGTCRQGRERYIAQWSVATALPRR